MSASSNDSQTAIHKLTRKPPNTGLRPRHRLRQVYPHPVFPSLIRRREQTEHAEPECRPLSRIRIQLYDESVVDVGCVSAG